MKAIVLVGGEGTRLRPLTWRTPKQLVPVLNRPLLDHLLLHLRGHGIEGVTLAMTRRSDAIHDAFGDGSRLGLALEYAYEDTPLGSGGAIASIAGGWTETFLVCNGDIVTDLDLTAMIESHRERSAELSISLHEVEDPSPFGVVDADEHGLIHRFVEKPPREQAPSRLINAGTWIFEPSVLREMDATQFNRVEDTLFPALCAAQRPIYGFHRPSFWADVGNSQALLNVNLALADGVVTGDETEAAPDASIGAPSVIGRGCRIDPGARVAESLLWDDVHVATGAVVERSILATGVRIGAGAHINNAVIAHEATVAPGARVAGKAIEPGVAISGGATHD
jgi:mannose-1-phosphate guanylyltransferase